MSKLKHLSNQDLLDELSSRVEAKIITPKEIEEVVTFLYHELTK